VIGPDRTSDVFEGLFAQICECKVEPTGRILLNPRRYANSARIGQSFEPGGDIDPVAEDVAILDDDVALMDADAQLDPLGFGNTGIATSHRLLRFGRTAQCIDDAGELDEEPVAGRLDQPPAMRSDRRVDHFGPDGPQSVEGSSSSLPIRCE
jgi:hypothetical protein